MESKSSSKTKKKKDKPYYPEQLAAANELNLDPDKDVILMKLAHDMCRPESMPANWHAYLDAENNRRYYHNSEAGVTQWDHPLIGYYRGAIFMERGGYTELLERDQASPPSEQEVNGMASYFGIKTTESSYILEVARMAVSAPIPNGWEEVEEEVTVDGRQEIITSYREVATGTTTSMHPLDHYFSELRDRRRKEMRKRAKTMKAVAAVSAMARMAGEGKAARQDSSPRAAPEEESTESVGTVGTSSRPTRGRPSIVVIKKAPVAPPEPPQPKEEAIPSAVDEAPAAAMPKPPSPPLPQVEEEPEHKKTTPPATLSARILIDLDATEGSVWDVDPQNSSMRLQSSSQPENQTGCYEYVVQNPEEASSSGEIYDQDELTDMFDTQIRDFVESVVTCKCQTLTILGWGEKGNGMSSSLFGDPNNGKAEDLVAMIFQAVNQSDHKDAPKVGGIKALLLNVHDAGAKDLVHKKEIDAKLFNTGVDLESALTEQKACVDRVKNLKALKALMKKALSNGFPEGSLLLTLKIEFRGSGASKPGWIHFVEISRTETNQEQLQHQGLAQQTELTTSMLGANLLGGDDDGILSCQESLLMKLSQCDEAKGGKMVILSHVNAADKHVQGSCRILSLVSRLSQALDAVKVAVKEGGVEDSQVVQDTIKLEILKTQLHNLKEGNEGHRRNLSNFRKLTEELCQRVEKLNSRKEPALEVLSPLCEGSEAGLYENEKFEEILKHLRKLAVDDAQKDEQLQAYAVQTAQLTQDLEKCTTRKEELKKSLEGFQNDNDGNAEKLGEYAEELDEMRAKMQVLRKIDVEKEEQLGTFQAELDQLRSSLTHQDELMKKMKNYEDEISRLSGDLHRLTSSEGQHLAKNETLETQSKQLMSQITELSSKETESRKTIQELASKVEQALQRLEEKTTESRHLQEESKRLARSLQDVQDVKRQLSVDLTKAKKGEEKLGHSLEHAMSVGGQQKEMVEKCKAEISALTQEIEQLRFNEKAKASELWKTQELSDELRQTQNRLAVLIEEKAILLDRLEGVTGEAQGDIYDDMPPPPPGLTVPPVDVKPTQVITPEMALSSIVRVVRIARPATKSTVGHSTGDDLEVEAVDPWQAVAMVRELRSERNELRRRDRLGRDEISQLRKRLKVSEDNAKSSTALELDELSSELGRAVGAVPAANTPPIHGLKAGIEAASILKDEAFVLKRQYSALAMVLKQEERKVNSKEKEIRVLKKAQDSDGLAKRPCCFCAKEKEALDAEREDLKDRLKELLELGNSRRGDTVHFDALWQKEDSRIQLQRTESRLRAVEKDRDRWKQLCQQKALNNRRSPETEGLFKWKSAPIPHIDGVGGKKLLPPLANDAKKARELEMLKGKKSFDCRPIPVEVKKRVQRMEDRIMKEPMLKKGKAADDKGGDPLLTGDPRDAEIANLKMRLVRAEMDRSEVASKAAAEKREAQWKIKNAARSLEEAQQITEHVQTAVIGSMGSEDSQQLVRYASQALDGLMKKAERLQSL